jgi:beta-glucosidase-like glycosyl hydrolase
VRAVEAGADMVLKPRDPIAAHAALLDALAAGRIGRERMEASVRRIFYAKQKLGILCASWLRLLPAMVWDGAPAGTPSTAAEAARAAVGLLGSAEHRAIVRRIEALAGGKSETSGSRLVP